MNLPISTPKRTLGSQRYTAIFLDGIGKLAEPVQIPAGEALFWASVGNCTNSCAVVRTGQSQPLLPSQIVALERQRTVIRRAMRVAMTGAVHRALGSVRIGGQQ